MRFRSPIVITALVSSTVALGAQALPTQLQVGEQEARQHLLGGLTSAGIPFGTTVSKAFLALPGSARGAVVTAAFAWMKVTVNSAAFKTAYAQARDQAKPLSPDAPGSIDQELKKRQDQQLKEMADSRAALNLLPADQRAAFEQQMKQMEAQLRSPEMVRAMRAQIEEDLKNDRESYDEEMKKWQANYPVNPLALVARRLQQFLAASADVDFVAKLVKSPDGKMRFENPAYESKSGDWKTCFRAGREAVGAARAAATAWLKELPPG